MEGGQHEGKTVIVTGASSGIGRRVAHRFGYEGANVVCASRSNEPHQGKHHDTDVTVPTEVHIREKTPGDATFVPADISDPVAAEELIKQAVEVYGDVDVLVNNAGIYREGDSQSTSVEDWRAILGVDLDGTFFCSKFAVPHLKRTAGSIINVASVNADEGGSGPAYSAACAGRINLTRDLAVELGPHDVNVNSVSPGYIKTPMQDYQDEEDIQVSCEQTLLPRLGNPEDVADVVSFLATESASFVHGANITVDGGWSAHRV